MMRNKDSFHGGLVASSSTTNSRAVDKHQTKYYLKAAAAGVSCHPASTRTVENWRSGVLALVGRPALNITDGLPAKM